MHKKITFIFFVIIKFLLLLLLKQFVISCTGRKFIEGDIMFFAIMLVCSPLNLIHHGNECFGIEDTKGYYLTKDKCNLRINEMETELLIALSYPVIISKNCIRINMKSA